jgi:hypothetical protein
VIAPNKKRFTLFSALGMFIALTSFSTDVSQADVPTQPTLVSFTMTPNSVDLSTTNPAVTFDLIVSNPTGILSTQTNVTLSDKGNNTVVVPITRTDQPTNSSLQAVEFKGTYVVPTTLPAGVYYATASPIVGLNFTGGTGYSSPTFSATSSTTIAGAQNGLLVRVAGALNFRYSTFNGPTFRIGTPSRFVDQSYANVTPPVWRAGLTIDLSQYYELVVPSLALSAKTLTPITCSAIGMKLTLNTPGSCEFVVSTPATNDYQYFQDDEVVTIGLGLPKPTLILGTIATQSSTTLPLTIQSPLVYGPTGVPVFPVSSTPSVCISSGISVTIVSGGTCTLNYSTPASSSFSASEVYPLTFLITRSSQSITFAPPAQVNLSSKSLSLIANASSGLPITFVSTTPAICSISGSSLNLLKSGACNVEANQVGNATVAPATLAQNIRITSSLLSARDQVITKVSCIRNGKGKVFAGRSCPIGWSRGHIFHVHIKGK